VPTAHADVLILGGFLAAAAALLAGASGFGFALVATPALLLSGYSLPFVVTANLLIVLATRLSVAWRLRHGIHRRRIALIVGGAVPGLWVGSQLLGAIDEHALKLTAGIVIALAAAALAWADRRPPPTPVRGATVVAGFLGGLLGTTTSLAGVPPALMLARHRLPTAAFFADLSVYFVVTAAIGLTLLTAAGEFDESAARAFIWWLPGVLVANAIGTSIGLRVPALALRPLTLMLAFAAGIATALSA
jgi:uncharacterized membrane protein YfcA